jgi:hypothetical protein
MKRDFPQKLSLKIGNPALEQEHERINNWQTGTGAQGVFLATTQPYSTKGTAGAFEFLRARPPEHPLCRSLWKLPVLCRIRKLPGS